MKGRASAPVDLNSFGLDRCFLGRLKLAMRRFACFPSKHTADVEVAPRAAPILLLVRDAAATDPELRGLLEELDADRLRRMTESARRLREGGHLRKGLTVARAAEVLWTYSAPELYELLVLRRSMPIQDYGGFIAEAICAAVLEPISFSETGTQSSKVGTRISV
jgi:hypothetical protein